MRDSITDMSLRSQKKIVDQGSSGDNFTEPS